MIFRWEDAVIELDGEPMPSGDGWQSHLVGLSAEPVELKFSPVRADDLIWDESD